MFFAKARQSKRKQSISIDGCWLSNELSCELNSARTLGRTAPSLASFCLAHFFEEQVWICIADG